MATHDFDTLFTKSRPHIFEKICLCLEYTSFKNCLAVNKAWKDALTSKTFQEKAKSVFEKDILEDEKKLIRYAIKGQIEEVRKLLSTGLLNVDCEDEFKRTPLLEAAHKGHIGVVHLLLDRGADPNTGNKYGYTPVYAAAIKGHKDVVQLLLDRGAHPNSSDTFGQTPLHRAVSNGHKDVTQLLLDRGADPDRADTYGWTSTSLHRAARRGDKDVVQLLLDRGADATKTDGYGLTPLQLAAQRGYNDIIRLLERRADSQPGVDHTGLFCGMAISICMAIFGPYIWPYTIY